MWRNKTFGQAFYWSVTSAVRKDVPYQRERDSLSATAESCSFLLELDKDSHHPKPLYDANNINKAHSAPLSTPFCFQQFSSLLYIFIMAYISVQLYS